MPTFDPNFDGVTLFNTCFDRRRYRNTELFERLPPASTPCIEPLSAVPVALVDGNITLSGVTANSYQFEYYYYTNASGSYALGERLTRAFTTDGSTLTQYWFSQSNALGIAPNPSDIVPVGEPYPIATQNITLDELPAVSSLTVPSANTSFALLQVKAADALYLSSLTSATDNLLMADMVRYRLDGIAPTATTGMFAGHGTVIQLDGKRQISAFRAIAKTDSIAFGSDIRPTISITYYVGTDQ